MKTEFKEKDSQKFKVRLEKMRSELTDTIRDSVEGVKSIDDGKKYSQHQADEATDNFARVVSLELTNKECSNLKQIERALEKIKDGTYGICDITGNPIPLARLEAIPYATMTVQAQENIEKGLM